MIRKRYWAWGLLIKYGGLVNKSIYQFKKVLDLQPDNVVALNNIGLIYTFRRVNMTVQFLCIKNCCRILPDYLEALYNLGLTFYFKGDIDKAVNTWKKVASIDPAL